MANGEELLRPGVGPRQDAVAAVGGLDPSGHVLTDRTRREAEQAASAPRLQQPPRPERIGPLAGGVAHDLNNLLAGIMNYAELVAAGLSSALQRLAADPELSTALTDALEIVKVARRAAELVTQAGGDLVIHAEQGHGPSIRVDLPASAEDATAGAGEHPAREVRDGG